MPELPFFVVDAFAERAFEGNPAAVFALSAPLADATMQSIAAELHLSETAFFHVDEPEPTLRWFTPAVEVDLCGHATLAAAHVLLRELSPSRASVTFRTQSGPLSVRREGEELVMDFPARPATPTEIDLEAAASALGLGPGAIIDASLARDLVVRLADARMVRDIEPDFAAVARLSPFAVCATAMGTGRDADVDFVSRFFAPNEGVPEDPVTGSAHCTLAPLWAARLGRTKLRARQVGPRGGRMRCVVQGDRVLLQGRAITTIRGQFVLST